MVAASHIFKGTGERVTVNGLDVAVTLIFKDFDLALIELPGSCSLELTELGNATVLKDAVLVNNKHTIRCKVLDSGKSLIYLRFPCSDLPQPGDSGPPILQDGRVIEFISSILISDCKGVAISSDILCRMRCKQVDKKQNSGLKHIIITR